MKKELRYRIMLTTAVIGMITAVVFGASLNIDKHFALIFGSLIYYPLAFLIVAGGFRWKWKGEAPWIATLVNLPFWVALIGLMIADSLVFLEWYAIIGITISIMIFEYKFFG